MRLEPQQTASYLALVQELRLSHRFYDTHVHPYEVLFDRFEYDTESVRPGVVSLKGNSYSSPAVTTLKFPEVTNFDDDARSQRLQDVSVMLLRKLYGNVGERVFLDQMALSGMDNVLLLPIAGASSTPDLFLQRLRWVKQTYRDGRFLLAGSVPAALERSAVAGFVHKMVTEYGIRALKCHPVVSGINLSTAPGKESVEELLVACSECRIPLIIHSGRNNPYWGCERGNYASLEYLAEVDFSLSKYPVILAHAGFHRCNPLEIRQSGLRTLDGMLQKYENLEVDISGLTLEPLTLVLHSVPASRILFGSDALYSSQWEAVTLVIHALKQAGMSVEENFVQYASLNPKKFIFEENRHVQHFQDQVAPVLGRS